MIVLEDAAFARFSLAEGDIAVPFEIALVVGEKVPTVTVYEEFLGVAEAFLSAFADDFFSDDAIRFLHSNLAPAMQKYGFALSPDDNRIRSFRLTPTEQVNLDIVRENTRLVSGKDDLALFNNRTTHEISLCANDCNDMAAIAICDGDIVAYAVINDCADTEDAREISVECAPAYRGCGFASSCAALLTDTLQHRGYTVLYNCRVYNAASERVAQKVGFCPFETRYSFVCYRD